MRYIFALILYIILFPYPIHADSEFVTTYDTSYKVEETGITTVTQNFHIVNKNSQFFPHQYISRIGKYEVADVYAYDKNGPLQINLNGSGEDRSISIKFNDIAAGIGQTLNWTLRYQTTEIAKKHGIIWDIYIPRPENEIDIESFTIGLYVPESFGSPYLLKPTPSSSNNVWDSSKLTTTGIFASYMPNFSPNPFQVYDYKLNYSLYNSKLYPVETEIALPPSTNYQKVLLQTLIPQPTNVRIDADGNWLAKYSLGPAANLAILATGSAVTYYHPQYKNPPLTDIAQYTAWKRYWETTDPRIVQMAKTHNDPKKAYELVIKTLDYDRTRDKSNIARLGATGILNSPTKAISLEFTDLFIAVARASGIPTREVNGVYSTQNTLHSWPEYFDYVTNQWIMVDPSLGKLTKGIDFFTTLDLSHFAFVIRGQSSTNPKPPETYKIDYHQGNFDQTQSPHISIRTNIPNKIISGFPYSGKIYIDNNGPSLFPANQLTILSNRLIVNSLIPTATIPPFGHLELPYTIEPISLTDKIDDIITIKFAGFEKEYSLQEQPIYTNPYLFVIGGLTVLGIISIIAQIARGLFLQKQKGRDHLHRQGKEPL